MSRKNKFPIYENVTVSDIAAEGKSIVKVNDIVIFVEGAVPGDVVTIQITKKKKRYCEARILSYNSYSSIRQKAFCKHFGTCGGCKWQILPYNQQLAYKEKQVTDQLTRIGKIEIQHTLPILAAPVTEFYRNKLEFTFSNKRWITNEEAQSGCEIENPNALGFHIPRLFDKIIDIETCYLQADPSNAIRNFIREYALQHSLTFYDIRNHTGFLRNIIIRNTIADEIMLIVIFAEHDSDQQNQLLTAVHNQFPEIGSLLYVVNQKMNDTIHDQEIHVFYGTDYITETMENLRFKIGPKSFYQTNSIQAYNLYSIVRNFAELSGNEIVYDLYTGTGTIANFVAAKAAQVIGIEYVPEAIEDAVCNSQANNITNTLFFAGDMKDILTEEFIQKHGTPDVIITDPPRAGMHEDVITTILSCKPQKIVYVSCNPATQARDLQLLSSQYSVVTSQAVDMFPHTHHVENVVLLKKI